MVGKDNLLAIMGVPISVTVGAEAATRQVLVSRSSNSPAIGENCVNYFRKMCICSTKSEISP